MAASGSRALYYLSDRRDLDHTGNTHARQKASKNVDCGDNLTLTPDQNSPASQTLYTVFN